MTVKTSTGSTSSDKAKIELPSWALTVDLSNLVFRHYYFLKALHDAGVTRRVTAESLRRYRLWLNALDAAHRVDDLTSSSAPVPPKDVAWLWHCHRLAPQKYEEFLQHEFMKISKSKFTGKSSTSSLLALGDPAGDPYAVAAGESSKAFWKKYCPKEPYELDSIKDDQAASANKTELLLDFDLLASARAQAEFYWQIQPMFEVTDGEAPSLDLKRGQQDYLNFLGLLKKYSDLDFKLVPTYEIDLFWHTHMTGGTMHQYHSDCEIVCGRLIDHDDSYGDGDRAKDAILEASFHKTAAFWKKEYGDDLYSKRGGYRGKPPADYFVETAATAVAIATLVEEDASDDSKKKPSSQKKNDGCCSRKNCCRCLIVCLIIGILFLVAGNVLFRSVGYACDIEPSLEEIESRGAPVCLTTSVRDGPLCLKAFEDPDSPAVWCQKDVASQWPSSYYLWWSPCDKCGTAWRMFEDRDDDKSEFKLLTDQPEPNEFPPSTTWLAWNDESEDWVPQFVTIRECSDQNIGENGIPSECYVEKDNAALRAIGGALTFLSILGSVVLGIIFCCSKCGCPGGTGAGYHETFFSSGSGGGGGGCGGGGGGK